MATNYLIEKGIHPLQRQLQDVADDEVKSFSTNLSLSKARYYLGKGQFLKKRSI